VAITTTAGLKTAMPGDWRGFSYAGLNAKGAGATQSAWTGVQASTSWTLATYPGASLAWSVLDRTTTGAFPFTNAPGGLLSYITRTRLSNIFNNTQGTLIIYDRLAQTGAITPAASTQTLTGGPTLTRPDALGGEVECWIESITASTSTASNYSIRYVDQDGNPSETSPVIAATATSVPGMMQRFNLNSGDTGVRSVDQFISTGASGGTAQLVLLRKILQIPLFGTTTLVGNPVGASTNIPIYDYIQTAMAQIPDDACLAFMYQASAASAPTLVGSLNIVRG
jgi:hypothetical protein